MTSKIDFENFKTGDKVIITISGENGEEIYPCKIIDIFPTEKLISFEDNESEYECKFSEVKSIVCSKKVIPYGILILFYFLLLIVLIRFRSPIAVHPEMMYLLVLAPILIFLNICQYFRIQNDKLSVYEKQNNIPYVLSVYTCIAMYPTIFLLTVFVLESVTKIMVGRSQLCEVLVCFLTWLPGLMFFIKDQVKLYQNKKKYCVKKIFWIRMVVFLVCSLLLAICIWSMIHY